MIDNVKGFAEVILQGDRSNLCRDMTTYHFCEYGGVRHLGFAVRVCGPRTKSDEGDVYRCKKIGWDQCSSFYNMRVSRFRQCGLKMFIFTPKIEVLGI